MKVERFSKRIKCSTLIGSWVEKDDPSVPRVTPAVIEKFDTLQKIDDRKTMVISNLRWIELLKSSKWNLGMKKSKAVIPVVFPKKE